MAKLFSSEVSRYKIPAMQKRLQRGRTQTSTTTPLVHREYSPLCCSHPFFSSSHPESKGSADHFVDISFFSTGTPPRAMAATWSTVFPPTPQRLVGVAPASNIPMHSRWPWDTAKPRTEWPSSSLQAKTSFIFCRRSRGPHGAIRRGCAKNRRAFSSYVS